MKAGGRNISAIIKTDVSIPSRGFYLMKDERVWSQSPDSGNVSIPSRGFYLMKAEESPVRF